MRRTWGYIVMAVATLVGVAALMLPLPETFAPSQPAPPPVVKKQKAAPVVRKSKTGGKAAKGAPKVPEPVKKIPKMDSVKKRLGAGKG